MTAMTPVDNVRRRRWPWVVAVVAVLVLVLAGAVVWSALSARTIAAEATVAQDQVVAAKTALVGGDLPAARSAVAKAHAAVGTAAEAADVLPLRVAASLPWVSEPIADVHALVGAAGDLVQSSDELIDVYGAISSSGTTPIFKNGAVNLTILASLGPKVDRAVTELDTAIVSLNTVQGTFPGTGRLAVARDSALAQAVPLRAQLDEIRPLLPLLPSALGAQGRRNYLLAILNPAELRASGGAPLSVAVLSFKNGKISMPIQGAITKVIPGVPPVSWEHLTGAPFVSGTEPQRFTNANMHPDFRISGEELARAWQASGQAPVAGVIAIDTTALAQVLRVTGPVQSTGFGKVTADNLVQKLLIDAYTKYATDQENRKSLNEELAAAFFQRIGSGSAFLPIMRALVSEAPGRHLQIHLQDRGLQQQVEKYALAGAVADGTDTTGAFSQNANASKTDVFQKRSIIQTVSVIPDGLAVRRQVTVKNDTPAQLTATVREGYLTSWNRSRWFLYLPRGASKVALKVPSGFTPVQSYQDGLGRTFLSTVGWLAGGQTAKLTLTYQLPQPTTYAIALQPQPMATSTQVSVRAPAGLLPNPLPKGWVSDGEGVTWTGTLDASPAMTNDR